MLDRSHSYTCAVKTKKNLTFLSIFVVIIISVFSIVWLNSNSLTPDYQISFAENDAIVEPVGQIQNTVILNRVSDRITIGETLSAALARHNISSSEIHHLSVGLSQNLNLRTIKAGDAFILEREVGAGNDWLLRSFELVLVENQGAPVRYRAVRESANADFRFAKIETPVTNKVVGLVGSIENNLSNSVISAGGDSDLVNRFANVFGSQVDFYREAQKDDTFKVIAEQRSADDRNIGYGNILAAEYVNRGKRYRGFYFKSKTGNLKGTFDEKGVSLEKTFLKNPMEITRITSRFGQRFHPVLRRARPHNGVDYGAPTGTPFWPVADGTVVEAGFSRFNGNWVRVRHKNGFMTEYLHASRLARGLRKGKEVKQGELLGYVGATGLATGPHLHFGMMINGRYVDPAKQKFPEGWRIPIQQLDGYLATVKPLIEKLNQLEAPARQT